MDSPFNYTVSSFIISNVGTNNDTEDEFENDGSFNDGERASSEFSFPTDFDTSVIDSDHEDQGPEMSTSADGDSLIYENIHENDESENSIQLDSDHGDTDEEQIEHEAKRFKLDTEKEKYQKNESSDLYQTCSICLTEWTNVGDHRSCALRCGHLFGYKCIKQWLNSNTENTKKCPQCNAKACVSHIRFIYANKLTCLDNSEVERIKKELEEVRLRVLKASKALEIQKKKTKKYKQMCKASILAQTTDSDYCFSD